VKSRIVRLIRNTLISTVVLGVVVLGAGIAYTWYNGQQPVATSQAIATPVDPTPPATIKAIKPAANAPVSASVQLLTSPVAPGENVSMSVKTVPTATCTIKVTYNKIPSTDSGLVAKTADEFGMVSWTWTVGTSIPHGTWPAIVTCIYNHRSAVVQGDVVVGRSAQ
jgi:hypothetical protein